MRLLAKSFLLAWLVVAIAFLPAVHAQTAYPDTGQSSRLTDYLHSHHLPLVGAQVLESRTGTQSVVLFGYTATDFGKNDAETKTRRFLKDNEITINNHIRVRPELASMRSRTPPAATAAEAPPSSEEPPPPDQLGGIDNYQNQQADNAQQQQQQQYMNQQQQQYMNQGGLGGGMLNSGGGIASTLIPLIGMGLAIGLGGSGVGMGISPGLGSSFGSSNTNPYGSYGTPYGGGYGPPYGGGNGGYAAPYGGVPYGNPGGTYP